MPAENWVLAGIVHEPWFYPVWQRGENFGTDVVFVPPQYILSVFWEHPVVARYDADILRFLHKADVPQKIPHVPCGWPAVATYLFMPILHNYHDFLPKKIMPAHTR